MNSPSSPGRPTRWIAALAVAALATGLSLAWLKSRPPRPPQNAGGPAARPQPGDDVIAQALEQARDTVAAPIDSTAYKQRWLDEVRNVDLTGLDPKQRDLFVRFANAQRCTCGCGFTLATCRESDMTCDVSTSRIAALVDSIRAGRITNARGIRVRPLHAG
jgi:hypothetical protein